MKSGFAVSLPVARLGAVAILGALVAAEILPLATPIAAQERGFRIQILASEDLSGAIALQEVAAVQLSWEQPVYVVSEGGMYKVRVGDFTDRGQAAAVVARMKALGYADAWVARGEIRLLPPGGGGGGGERSSELARPLESTEGGRQEIAQRSREPSREMVEPSREVPESRPEAPVPEPDPAKEDPAPVSPVPEDDRMDEPAVEPLPWPRVEKGSVSVDGSLDDAAWGMSHEGRTKPAATLADGTPETSVRYAYDEEAFYIGTEVLHPDGEKMRSGAFSDAPADQERVIVTLNRNGWPAHSFGVTIGGFLVDYATAEGPGERAWSARVSMELRAWTAEMRVPFETMDIQSAGDDAWDVSVRWEDPKARPRTGRTPLPMQAFLTAFAQRGMTHFAVRPFVQTSTLRDTGPGGWDTPASRVGGELILDVGDRLEVGAQVQPDYAHVLPDPATVRLEPYETRFRETRPFFRSRLDPGDYSAPDWGPSLLYSRRIGGVPASAAPPGFVESLLPTNVLGVGSVRGRSDRTKYAATMALSDVTRTTSSQGTPGAPIALDLSPRTWFGAARLERRIDDRGGALGVTLTGVGRSMDPSGRLADLLADQALTATLDLDVPQGVARVQGFMGVSHLTGSAAAIEALQRSSAHYFGRPDADHLTLTSGATSLSGMSAGFSVSGTTSALRWTGQAAAESPGYDIRDLGFMRSADDIDALARVGVGRDGWTRGSGLQNRPWGVDVGVRAHWNFAGVPLGVSPEVRGSALLDGWEALAAVRRDRAGLSDELTRGGPLMSTPAGWFWRVDVRRLTEAGSLSFTGEVGVDELGGRWRRAGGLLSSQISPQMTLWLEPTSVSWIHPRQYTLVVEEGPAETFGRRYVFARLDYSEVSTRLGVDLDLDRGLSISGYAEPFLSSAGYSGFGELMAARGNDLLVYGTEGTAITTDPDGNATVAVGGSEFAIPAPDFHVRSFRSHLALRWQWDGNGSVSLAWRQTRSALENRFMSPSPLDFGQTLGDFGRNLLLLRLGYRWGWP